MRCDAAGGGCVPLFSFSFYLSMQMTEMIHINAALSQHRLILIFRFSGASQSSFKAPTRSVRSSHPISSTIFVRNIWNSVFFFRSVPTPPTFLAADIYKHQHFDRHSSQIRARGDEEERTEPFPFPLLAPWIMILDFFGYSSPVFFFRHTLPLVRM